MTPVERPSGDWRYDALQRLERDCLERHARVNERCAKGEAESKDLESELRDKYIMRRDLEQMLDDKMALIMARFDLPVKIIYIAGSSVMLAVIAAFVKSILK